MSYITISENRCTRCGACVSSCPVAIIDTDSNQLPLLKDEKESLCINCFHCEAICPTQALEHTLAAKGLKSALKSDKIIEANDLGHYMQNRRSIRQFKATKIDRERLEQIMDVVRFAPTGTNRQMTQWIIVSDSALIDQLAEATINWMRMVVKGAPEMGMRYNFPGIIANWEAGLDRICRHAPHLAICHTPTAYPVGPKDGTIAAAHLELFLPSMGLGACWAGFLMIALEQQPDMKQLIGLGADQTVHAALMMGYPKYKYKDLPARNAAKVQWM